MKKLFKKISDKINFTPDEKINYDALRLNIKGDCSIREMLQAFKKQEECDKK